MNILLHICCGPCSIYPVKKLREEQHRVRGYFYNPNIHPYTEWKKRLDTLKEYAEKIDLPLIVDENYELEDFLQQVVYREKNRCRICYYMRLLRAAKIAKKGKFDAFTTTLLVSPFQKHEMIKEIGEEVAEKTGIPFYYQDFRPGFKEATAASKEMQMYRQQYCGCIFSEKERYCR
ncbi:hypothetical protein Tfer_0140 [Thermincola ferriacetica]|uniref:Epoxyqueuosine reductase QueH n=2 Tax=Thermincola TaxID=278993 RepID=D5XEH6_THEPJ|nr:MULTISPECIES: epoxyqueuosine reductase QueH [Thermincola]ADG82047.1 protein of unknown function DUF208 [Thermincola potens JR]KNZ71065.1 hypothetical protein Tfer_0140 [Thermincola ferriacetica]